MKKLKSILSVILALTMLFAALPLSLNSAYASQGRSGWFYDQLTDNEKVFYDALASMDLASGTATADLTDSSKTGRALTQAQLEGYVSGNSILTSDCANAFAAFEIENPDLYYVDFSKLTFRVGQNSSGKYLAYICSGSNPNYYRFGDLSSKAAIAAADEQFNAKINEIANAALEITGATEEDTAVERIRYVHNTLINGCRYVYPEDTQNGEKVFTAYGCLILGESVCEGYAEAAKLILNKIGIECELISGLGKEVNDLTAESGIQSHMWNYVKVGSNWYALDVTWDDPISIKRVTVGNASTPVTDANGNYVYNDICREKYFLLGSDTFFEDHSESAKIADFGRDFVLPAINACAYGLEADDSGLVVQRLTLRNLKDMYKAGEISAEQYSLYAEYADIKETKYTVAYGVTDTTIAYDEKNPIGTVITHTADGVKTTYTLTELDYYTVETDDGNGNVTSEEVYGFIEVAVDAQFANYTHPRYDITITEILGDRNPYFAVSYNNMNEDELNKQGMYLSYSYDYVDNATGETIYSPWTPFIFFKTLAWTTNIPGKTIVVGMGEGNYFAVADFYPSMLNKNTTDFTPQKFGMATYRDLIFYNQLVDWQNSDGTLNMDVFIAYSEAFRGPGRIYAQPFVRVATPSQNSITLPGKTYNVRIEYDEPLKLKDEGVQPTYNMTASALAEYYSTTALEHAKVTDFAWDGDSVITFKFTPSPMYNDNNCQYGFTFPGLVGKYSNLEPRYYSILVEQPAIGLSLCPRCPPSAKFFTMGTPLLIEDENLDNIVYYDGKKVSDNAKFGLSLVASKPDEGTTETMEAAAETAIGKEVLASSTYNIKLNLRNCQTARVVPGQKITIGLPYPIGYGPQDAGIEFKAYHYKVDDQGNYIAEELDCYIGEYGLVVYAESFSPFAVVVVEKDEAAPETKSVYAVSSTGGTVSSAGIASYASTDSISYTLTPDADFVLESVLVNGTESIASVNSGVLTLNYADLPASTQISAVFTAVSVVEAEGELDFTPTFVEVSPHVVSDWVTVRNSCLEPGYRYTYCLSCELHEEIERINDVPALASHSFGAWTVVTAATATDDGAERRTCSLCSAAEERAIPATGEPTTEEPETEPDTDPTEKPSENKSFFTKLIEAIKDFFVWLRSLFSM